MMFDSGRDDNAVLCLWTSLTNLNVHYHNLNTFVDLDEQEFNLKGFETRPLLGITEFFL